MKKIFEALVPGWKGVSLPDEFPLPIRMALRISVVVAHIFSIMKYGLPFGMLSFEKRVKIIEKLYKHRNTSIRNIVQFWKLTALMTQCR